jgi:phage terminase large subunit-like protein
MNIINDLYNKYDAAGVVVETNYGGKQTWQYLFRTKNAGMKVIPIHNSPGKTTRAEHISSLYYQHRVHHTKSAKEFKQLEDQMCSFNVDYTKSPDRIDSLGLALTELFWPTDASGNKVSILNLTSR